MSVLFIGDALLCKEEKVISQHQNQSHRVDTNQHKVLPHQFKHRQNRKNEIMIL